MLLRADDLPAELRAVMERGQTLVETHDEQETLSVPIIVRGTLLGAMAFRLPPARHMTERQLELARSVAERLGTALENTRLFEQSRTLAQRERQANESAARLQGIVDVETLINLAASDFREVLGAVYTRVSLNLDPAAQQTAQEAS
jgi:GAF domain-containing protein